MQQAKRKHYSKPCLSVHGSVEEITGWNGGSAGEFFGGTQGGGNRGIKVPFKHQGPAGCAS